MAVRHFTLLFVFVLTAALFPGCAAPPEKYVRNGKEYGTSSGSFRGRWWNYYERGRSFADGRFYDEAAADFKQAIAGRGSDQWRSRTYGMHFIDYFPHRELGVVYFQSRQYDRAVAELETSISTAPSAKGHYFLNKARAILLRRKGGDGSPPELLLEGGQDDVPTNSFTREIRGVAQDDRYVAAVRVGDISVPIELATPKQAFRVVVPLREGENVIPVVVTDLVGKTTEKELTVLCDRRGPLVEIIRVEKRGGRKIVHGVITDSGGLRSLAVNDKPRDISGPVSSYDFSIPLQPGTVQLVATDRAGNVTRAVLRAGDFADEPSRNPQLALLDPSAYPIASSLVLSDVRRPLVAVSAPARTDTEPPFIKLEELDSFLETYEDYVLLEGMVADFSPVNSLSVNGEPVASGKGRKLYFTLLKKLDEGDNEFRIVAVDALGNRSEKKIKVRRKIQNIRQIGARLSVAVLPFEHKGEASPLDGVIYDQLLDSFLEQKRFNMVERRKIDAVLRELKLSATDLVDPDRAVDLGRIVSANILLAGTVVESPDSVEIIARMIDTETATILAGNDIFGEDKSFSSLNNLLDGLAFKFKRDFPIFEGSLIEVRGDEVLIDVGSEQRVKPNIHLICYRKGREIRHPVTGKILGSEPQILGELTVREVFEGFSKADLRDKDGEIKVFDRVIAR